jgi:hypothetical protein
VFSNLAPFVGSLTAYILPPDDDTEALKDNENIRIIFAIPTVFYFTGVVFLLTCVWHETPKWYLARKKRRLAIKTISLYTFTENPDEMCNKLESESNLKS